MNRPIRRSADYDPNAKYSHKNKLNTEISLLIPTNRFV